MTQTTTAKEYMICKNAITKSPEYTNKIQQVHLLRFYSRRPHTYQDFVINTHAYSENYLYINSSLKIHPNTAPIHPGMAKL